MRGSGDLLGGVEDACCAVHHGMPALMTWGYRRSSSAHSPIAASILGDERVHCVISKYMSK